MIKRITLSEWKLITGLALDDDDAEEKLVDYVKHNPATIPVIGLLRDYVDALRIKETVNHVNNPHLKVRTWDQALKNLRDRLDKLAPSKIERMATDGTRSRTRF